MPKVFLFEHEEHAVEMLKANLQELTAEPLDVVVEDNVASAVSCLEATPAGEFALLTIDLLAPPTAGVTPDYRRHATQGFDVVEAAWRSGHRQNIVVLSAMADDAIIRKRDERLRNEGMDYNILHKSKDLASVADWEAHFAEYFEDLSPLIKVLEDHHPSKMFIVDPVQETTLRQLLRFVRTSLKRSTARQKIPVVCLTGDTASGKTTTWAPCLPILKWFLVANGKPSGKCQIPYSDYALSQMSEGLPESERGKIFGISGWVGDKGGAIDADGVLMDATRYVDDRGGGAIKKPITGHKPDNITTDFLASGYCLLDEILSSYTRSHELLYHAIDNGVVPTEGAHKYEYPIACTIVTATNYDLSTSVKSSRPNEIGTIPEAMMSRIGAFIHAPALRDLAFSSVIEIIRKFGKEVQPLLHDQIQDRIQDGTLDFRSLKRLVSDADGPRITRANLVRYVAIAKPRASMSARVPTSSDTWQAGARADVAEDSQRPAVPHVEADADSVGLSTGSDWPDHVRQRSIEDAQRLWLRIQATDGDPLRGSDGTCNILEAVSRADISPASLLALVIIAYSESRFEAARERLDRWFGMDQARNPLRSKLVALSRRYPKVFSGAGNKGNVTMTDLERWAASWTEGRRVTDAEVD